VKPGRHWLKVKLLGTKSNRTALGSRVTLHYGGKLQAQEVVSQSSFYSVNDLRLHFGLGEVKEADVEVRWPTGQRETFKNVPIDRLITIKEGKGIVKQGW
jgi:hypothetical protein